MRVRNFFVIVSLALLLSGIARANRQEYRTAAIKTANGALLVWNQPDNYFTLEIKGKDVRPNNSSPEVFFKVDGIIIQFQSALISQFVKDADKAGRKIQSILMAHRDWEAQYAGSMFGKKLDVQSSPVKLKNGSEALFWKFDMPDGFNREAKKQLYLVVVNSGYVIVLNGVVTEQTKEEDVRQLLIRTVETLKVSSKPFDLKELTETIRREGSQ
jgi:hypothetical protein